GWYKESSCTNAWNFGTDVVAAGTTLYAKWTINAYLISTTIIGSGTISPSGNAMINCGGSATYTFTPSNGYYISNVTVDGTSVGAVNSYTISNVKEDHLIVVTFALSPVLTISTSSLVFDQISGTITFSITSNQNWTITDNATWLTESPDLGSNNATVSVTFNRLLSGERSGTITVTGGGITRTINVVQRILVNPE
ncbi:MAG TPA: hypothetical protein DIW31_01485, partial [Bacteroidales bacterium]|nr:hypothetical protein [Bacteroidales bacterium]